MIATTHACALLGTAAVPVEVEASVERGLPRMNILGLRAADAVDVRERVSSALRALGVDDALCRITVNLAPADLPKAGASFDVPVLISVLAALGELPIDRVAGIAAHGELGLDGQLRPVMGTMATAMLAAQQKWSELIVAPGTARRAAHAPVPVIEAATAQQLVEHLRGTRACTPAQIVHPSNQGDLQSGIDMADVRGADLGVEAVRIAAAGGHNLLMFGPPGCGKSMLAARLPGLLPPLASVEALEVATVHDAAGVATGDISELPPLRQPHHSISQQALIGGGSSRPVIGEVSLAHHGVLFLDELPEFRPTVLDALRQPLEERVVRIRRARWMVEYPASFMLVAAMNLCRCGRYGAREGAPCSCTRASVESYLQRVSGALLDRFDLRVRMDAPTQALHRAAPAPSSDLLREQVREARSLQQQRWGSGSLNGQVAATTVDMQLNPRARTRLEQLVELGMLSARAQRSLVRVARTIADLDGSGDIRSDDITRARFLLAHPGGEQHAA